MKTKGQWWAFGPFWQYITRAGGDNYGEQLDKHSDHDANNEENYGKNNHGNKYDINDGNDDHPWDDLAFLDFSWWMTKELPVPHHHHLFRNKEEPTNKQSTKTKEINKRIACPTPWRIICGGEYLYIHKENKSIWPILITQNVRYSWIQIVWTYICLISCHFYEQNLWYIGKPISVYINVCTFDRSLPRSTDHR